MSQIQPDENPAFQAFHCWMLDNFKSTGQEGDGKFLPHDLITKHLEADDYFVLNGLLKALYPDQIVPINAKEVVITYSKVFCILVHTGQAHFLQRFMEWDDLNDAHLPFTDRPRRFPISPHTDFFEAFYDAQWIFCPPAIHSNCNRRLHHKEILPFISRSEAPIGKGSSAEIFKVEIYPLYNALPVLDDTNRSLNTFALKTYLGKDALKAWENEVKAFKKVRRLRDQRHAGSPHIIGFHTAFKHGDTCHVLLEYADRGSLEHYLLANPPPASAEDIARFWKEVLGLLRGLKDLHNGEEVVWHQDIKPANILVLSNSSTNDSPYNSTFKIADLGTSHSKRITSTDNDLSDRDAQGTRTYGAPECYRSDGSLGEGSIRVTVIVDVFSLGAVFSEIAVWIAGGKELVLEYREARRKATEQIPDFHGGDCFHNGTAMLPAVQEWHRDVIAKQISRDDLFTAKLVPMIEEMLRQANYREDANSFCTKATRLFATALEDFRRQWPSKSIPEDVLPSSLRMQYQRTDPPIQPPDFKPTHTTTPRAAQSSISPSMGYQAGSVLNDTGIGGAPSISISPQAQFPVRTNSASSTRDQQVQKGVHEPGQSAISGRRSQIHTEPVRTTIPIIMPENNEVEVRPSELPAADWIRSTPGEASRQIPPSMRRESGIATNANSTMGYPHIPGFSIWTDDPGVGSSSMNYGRPASPYSPQLGSRILPSRPSTRLPLHPASILHPMDPPSTPGANKSVMYLSRSDAMRWREKRKSYWNRESVELPTKWVLGCLAERDSVLIVDDSQSMRRHWLDMTELVGIFAYIIKAYDENGLDMYFASSPQKHHEKKSSKLVQLLDQRKYLKQDRGHTDMSSRLEQVLGDYERRIRAQKKNDGIIRGLNVYIFTDANWQPECDIVPAIDQMVRTLVEQHLPEKQVGLQFISFGNDSECLRRLRLVDNCLVSKPELPFDIVDTTPSDGNLYKMIRGAIDRNYDYEEVPPT